MNGVKVAIHRKTAIISAISAFCIEPLTPVDYLLAGDVGTGVGMGGGVGGGIGGGLGNLGPM